jgi:hypothetical protein
MTARTRYWKVRLHKGSGKYEHIGIIAQDIAQVANRWQEDALDSITEIRETSEAAYNKVALRYELICAEYETKGYAKPKLHIVDTEYERETSTEQDCEMCREYDTCLGMGDCSV